MIGNSVKVGQASLLKYLDTGSGNWERITGEKGGIYTIPHPSYTGSQSSTKVDIINDSLNVYLTGSSITVPVQLDGLDPLTRYILGSVLGRLRISPQNGELYITGSVISVSSGNTATTQAGNFRVEISGSQEAITYNVKDLQAYGFSNMQYNNCQRVYFTFS